MILATVNILAELAPWLLLGAVASAALHWLVPSTWLQKQLSGPSGVVKAVALGVPMPLCSCGVIPAGIGLKRDGASTGSAIGFLVSTPQTGVDSVLVTASMLGWPFAIYKLFAAALTGLAAGWIADAVDPRPVASEASAAATAARPSLRESVDHAVDVIRSIWRWLAFGILVSAALTTFVPADALAETVLGAGAVAVLAVLLLSVPLYVCATASVPIAASLVAAGLPTGAALVFLMAGPATNVATIGAVRRTFGGRVTAVYLGVVIVGSVGLGLLFDAWFPAAIAVGQAHVHTGVFGQIAAAGLGLAMLYFAAEELNALRQGSISGVSMQIPVEGLNCGSCDRKVTQALRAVPGVDQVSVDHEVGLAVVQGSASLAVLHQAIRGAGFRPVADP